MSHLSNSEIVQNMMIFCIVLIVALFAAIAVYAVWVAKKNRAIRERIYGGSFIPCSRFEKDWIAVGGRGGHKGVSGYKYEDGPGCYVILIFDHPVQDDDWSSYKDVYVGQSINVCQRVHNHFNGKGNGDVYADVRGGKHVYVQFQRCPASEMNELEKSLIEAFGATGSYNSTKGGGARR